MNLWKRAAQLSALGACCSLAIWISGTVAKPTETSIVVNKPISTYVDGPALPPPEKPIAAQPASKQNTQPTTRATKQPFMRPAEPRASTTADSKRPTVVQQLPQPADAPIAPPRAERDIRVHPAPPIDYETHRRARRMYHSGQLQMVMVAQDPADGCCYEIPLCIPACCTDAPTVSSGRGIFGRGVVEYCWSCGFKAKVKFRHVLGDVKVDYEVD
jgi:hypothetical protein